MATLHHALAIHAPQAAVYAALASAQQIGTWWDAPTAVQTEHGLVLEHNPGPEHGVVRLRVVEQVADRRIEWECISSHPASSPASAWTGTHFMFELSSGADVLVPGDDPDATRLDFFQVGYDEHSPFYEFNKAAWAEVLGNLKRVLEAAAPA